MNPRVSIGMPVYDSRPEYFELALDAVLAQDFGDFELILSDNASHEPFREMFERAACRDQRIRYVRHEQNQGAVFNFNFVLAEARAPYFLWAADDNLYHRQFLARTVPLLDRHPEAVVASSEMSLIDDQGKHLAPVQFSQRSADPSVWRRVEALMAKHVYMDIYALHRREALNRTSRAQALYGADFVLVLEQLLQGTVARDPEMLFSHRMHHAATAEYVSGRLVGERAPAVASRGILRMLVRRFAGAIVAANLPAGSKAACLAVLAGVVLRRRRNW